MRVVLSSLPRPPRRRVLGWAGAAAGAVAAPLWWRSATAGDPLPAGEITVSTGVPSGVYSQYGKLLRSQLSRDLPQLRVTLLASEGSVENIERLAAGEADFAIATADSLAAYRAGGGRAADRLRACARLYDDYLQLVVGAARPSAGRTAWPGCGSEWVRTSRGCSWSPGSCWPPPVCTWTGM